MIVNAFNYNRPTCWIKNERRN